ncbi:hypothetical protein, unknown function [Leishmania tarentolae]|uniref:PI3K/PI4K catalytic domain-containing protein n=1 Tax=Leishmania tarentolae TaxID=5689 RepID=A0A640KKL4_LEITA|nr:hypothetical protein, unknown function [Leishmania tarentolae]
MREEPRWHQVGVVEDARVQQQRSTSVSTSSLTSPLLLQPSGEVLAVDNYTSRGADGSNEGSVCTTVTSNVTDHAGPSGNCQDGGPARFNSSRELGLTPFADSTEDDQDDRGSKWDRTPVFDVTTLATLHASSCHTTSDITSDRLRSSNTSSSTYWYRGDLGLNREKSSPGADTAVTPEAGAMPSFSVSLSSTSLCEAPSVRGPFPVLMRCGNNRTQRSQKCIRGANPACADCSRCTGRVACTSTPTTVPSTSLLSPSYAVCFQHHNATPISDKDGGGLLRLGPCRHRNGSRCGSHEYWIMKPRLSGVNEVLLQHAPASDVPQLFDQALAAFQLWDSVLHLELYNNSAGGTYMVRLARPAPRVSLSPSSSVTTTSATTDSDSRGAVVAVFKPCDEEIGQEGNPHANRESDHTETFAPGSGSRREVLAYLLDHGHNAGVPPTLEVASTYWAGVCSTAAYNIGGGGASTARSSIRTLDAVTGGEDASANGSLCSPCTGETDWRGISAGDDDSVSVQVAAPTNLRIGSLQLFMPDCKEAADVLPGHFDVDEVHALAIFDIRTVNGDRHGGNVLVSNYHRFHDGNMAGRARRPRGPSLANATERHGAASSPSVPSTAALLSPENSATTPTAKDDAPHLIPIDHSYICPSGYADPDYEWLSWPQSKKPFSARNMSYIAALDAVADGELVRSALLAYSEVTAQDVRMLRVCADCNGFEMAERQRDAAQTSPMHGDAEHARVALQDYSTAFAPARAGAGSATLATHHLPQHLFGRRAAAAILDDFTGISHLQTVSAKKEATTTTTSAVAPPSVSGAATVKKSGTIDAGTAAPSTFAHANTWDTAAVERTIDFDRGEDLSTEEAPKDAAALRARAISTAWPASSFSNSLIQALHAGPHQHATDPAACDRASANTAAELIRCSTRLLQIAALEFHMTAYEIGSLCRRPRVTQASVLEEVLEQARDEQTWELDWSRLDNVIRQRLPCCNMSG